MRTRSVTEPYKRAEIDQALDDLMECAATIERYTNPFIKSLSREDYIFLDHARERAFRIKQRIRATMT